MIWHGINDIDDLITVIIMCGSLFLIACSSLLLIMAHLRMRKGTPRERDIRVWETSLSFNPHNDYEKGE